MGGKEKPESVNMESVKHDTYDALRLENQLCFPLYACAKEVIRQYRKPLDDLKLTYTQYIVMLVLWEFGDMTEGELGRKVYLDSGTLAPLLKRLEKQGLIERVRPKNNERKLFLKLTADGETLKQKALSVPLTMKQCIRMPEADISQVRELLLQALQSMEMR